MMPTSQGPASFSGGASCSFQWGVGWGGAVNTAAQQNLTGKSFPYGQGAQGSANNLGSISSSGTSDKPLNLSASRLENANQADMDKDRLGNPNCRKAGRRGCESQSPGLFYHINEKTTPRSVNLWNIPFPCFQVRDDPMKGKPQTLPEPPFSKLGMKTQLE